jgi:hypothetical protein
MIDQERSKRMHEILISLSFALLFFGLAGPEAKAQGGPPYVTNDPGTPGNKQWEINIGYEPYYHSDNYVSHTPDIDINYGFGDYVQLTLETAYLTANMPPVTLGRPGVLMPNTPNVTYHGLEQSELGVKWRFYDNEKKKFAMSIFPQVLLNNPNLSVAHALATRGSGIILPMEFTKTVGPVDVDFEFGYIPIHYGPNQWLTGLVIGHDLTKKWEIDAEFYATQAVNGTGKYWTGAGGARYKIHPPFILLLMAGRSLVNSTSSQPYFLGYFGMQFLLPPRPFDQDP